MDVAVYDTHQFIKELREQGFTEPQAETIVRITGQMRETDNGNFAFKEDLQVFKSELRSDLHQLELLLVTQIKDLQIKMGAGLIALVTLLTGIMTLLKFWN